MRFCYILEDDPAQMEVLTGWAESRTRRNGFGLARELMRVASRESFDLFLVDWVLPDLTGEQVLRWLRVERGNDTPAIFITSRDAEDIANAFSAGADDYLVKPPRAALNCCRAHRGRDAPLATAQCQPDPGGGAYHFDLARKVLTVSTARSSR